MPLPNDGNPQAQWAAQQDLMRRMGAAQGAAAGQDPRPALGNSGAYAQPQLPGMGMVFQDPAQNAQNLRNIQQAGSGVQNQLDAAQRAYNSTLSAQEGGIPRQMNVRASNSPTTGQGQGAMGNDILANYRNNPLLTALGG
jgi:hypothetical protein